MLVGMRPTGPSLPAPAPATGTRASRLAAYRWELALIGVTAVWGATFVAVRDAVATIPPFTFVAYRFLAAAALLAGARPRALAGRPRGLVAAGVVTGIALFAGYGFQTPAQREVSPTKTAVILTMEPVFAGVFGFLLAGERLSARGWAGACCILAGMLVAELGRPPTAPGRAGEAFE